MKGKNACKKLKFNKRTKGKWNSWWIRFDKSKVLIKMSFYCSRSRSYPLLQRVLLKTLHPKLYSERSISASTGAYQLQDQQSQRAFLSAEYECRTPWEKRLESPLLKKIDLEEFFHHIDKKYQQEKVISAIDVDLYVQKASESEDLDDVEELAYRLRKSPATAKTLPSTSHAIIRSFLAVNRTDDLMRMLNDRINYGIFLDYFTANLLMDSFLAKANYRDATKIASFLMLQEDFAPSSTTYFSLLSCLKYLETPQPEPWDPFQIAQEQVEAAPKSKKKKEEEKVRVKVQRNLYFDDHFDLIRPYSIIGKTLVSISWILNVDKSFKSSVELVGLALFDKWSKVEAKLKEVQKENTVLASSVVQKVVELSIARLAEIDSSPNKTPPRPDLRQIPGFNLDAEEIDQLWNKLKWDENFSALPNVKALLEQKLPTADINLISKTEEYLSKSLSESEMKEIECQISTYSEWEKQRQEELDKQVQRMKDIQTLLDIQVKKKELAEREEVIFFFDNEEQWMMRQPAPPKLEKEVVKKQVGPATKKGKVTVVEDADYVPPEIHTFADPSKTGTPTGGVYVHTKKKK